MGIADGRISERHRAPLGNKPTGVLAASPLAGEVGPALRAQIAPVLGHAGGDALNVRHRIGPHSRMASPSQAARCSGVPCAAAGQTPSHSTMPASAAKRVINRRGSRAVCIPMRIRMRLFAPDCNVSGQARPWRSGHSMTASTKGEQLGRDVEPERLGGLEVDDKFELGRPGRPAARPAGALENAPGVDATPAIGVRCRCHSSSAHPPR